MFSLGKQNHQLPLREENTQKSLVLLYSLGEHNLDRLLLLYSEDISDVTSTVTQYSWLAKSDKNKRND